MTPAPGSAIRFDRTASAAVPKRPELGTSATLLPVAVATKFLGIWLVRITPTELFNKIACWCWRSRWRGWGRAREASSADLSARRARQASVPPAPALRPG
jgi:hypothetical protein